MNFTTWYIISVAICGLTLVMLCTRAYNANRKMLDNSTVIAALITLVIPLVNIICLTGLICSEMDYAEEKKHKKIEPDYKVVFKRLVKFLIKEKRMTYKEVEKFIEVSMIADILSDNNV